MALSKARIAELYAGPHRKSGTGQRRKRGAFYMIATEESCELVKGKPSAEIVGAFSGKQGSIRRSRKGASRIQPNGFRRYQADWWNTAGTVTAYKV
jgi:hypothetical protein